MHETKEALLRVNGQKCMLCGRGVPYALINWHHIKPKAVCKRNHEPIDNSYENGALLCVDCHAIVHSYQYGSDKYTYFTMVILANKKPNT